MKNYDPNLRGKQKVKITLQQWDYVGHVIFELHGNCCGLDIICAANFADFSDIEGFENDCELRFDEDTDVFSVKLKNDNGDTLLCEEDGYSMNDMIVAVEILELVEEQA